MLKNQRISLTFGFFFILAVTSSGDSLAAWSLLFCILHEAGHILAMSAAGVRPSEIKFYGAGISITADGLSSLPRRLQGIIYLSGPAVNLALAAILSGDAAALNLFFAIFNLLPVPYFDGGKLLALVFPQKRRLRRTIGLVTWVMLGGIAVAAVISGPKSFEPSSFMTLAFIAMAYFLDG